MRKTENGVGSEQRKLVAGTSSPVDAQGAPSGDRTRRLAALLGGTAGIALFAAQAHAISINDQVAAQFGGIANYYDSSNQYPNAISIVGANGRSFCSGSLINSRTVLTAAHCFYDSDPPHGWDGGPTRTNPGLAIPSVSFAPIAGPTDPNFRTVSSIYVHRGYISGGNTDNDIALITLAQPVTAITPVTLMNANTPIPPPGTVLTMAGYGANGTGSQCCNPIDNRRRVATTELGAYATNGTNQPYYRAQFRNPLSPNNPNVFNLNVPASPLEGGPNGGDSGGPLWIQTPSGLVQIGELQGGGSSGTYGMVNDWTPLNLFLDWLAQNNPLRQVSVRQFQLEQSSRLGR